MIIYKKILDNDQNLSQEYIPKGKLLENPYEIHNFRTAFQQVVDSLNGGSIKTGKGFTTAKGDLDSTIIVPNYVYLRFNPIDSIQDALLNTHQEIIFMDYPFEYDESEDYKATLNPDEIETLSYWCSVPINQELPNIPYEVLQEMYLPEADPEYNDNSKGDTAGKKTARGKVNDKVDLMNHVLEAAYTATNNEDLLPEPPPEIEKGESCETCFLGINLRDRWTPKGNLQIWDDNIGETTTRRRVFVRNETYPCSGGGEVIADLNGNALIEPADQCTRPVYRYENVTEAGSYIPLEGANVLARDTWTIASAITNSSGNWSMKRIRAKARFLIQWDRHEFSIRDNTGAFQAEDKGPKLHKKDWNHKIKGGREQYRGHIFQAAMHFYYHNIGGLGRPPTNAFWNVQMKIAAKETSEGASSHVQQFRAGGILPTIRIKKYGDPSEEVYGTTIHELAHAAHWRFDKNAYNGLVWDAWIGPGISNGSINFPGPTGSSARRTLESWATGVEVFLTRMRYRRLGNPDYEYDVPDFDTALPTWGNYQIQLIDNNGDERFYTSAVWDMVDNFNQRGSFVGVPVDNVDGFTMPQLENAMRGAESWNAYRNRVLQIGRQQNEVRELFANWD